MPGLLLGRNGCIKSALVAAVVLMVSTVGIPRSPAATTEAGLNEQVDLAGNPVQLNVTVPL